jgi:hypothetical protein
MCSALPKKKQVLKAHVQYLCFQKVDTLQFMFPPLVSKRSTVQLTVLVFPKVDRAQCSCPPGEGKLRSLHCTTLAVLNYLSPLTDLKTRLWTVDQIGSQHTHVLDLYSMLAHTIEDMVWRIRVRLTSVFTRYLAL